MPVPVSIVPLETHFLHWGFVSISAPNAIVIATMIVVFILAVVIPFPHTHDDGTDR